MNAKKEFILIVDDNPQNLQVLGNLLTENGFKIGFACNGSQVLDFIKNKLPDLILLDVMMPGMNGYEVCEKLKADKRYRHIPIIFLTAKTETENIVKGFQVGGVDYIAKPFITEELLARVKTHIQIKILKSFLPICAKCKKIRDEEGIWMQMEHYFMKHIDAEFSHGICEECADDLYGNAEWYKKEKKET